MRGAALGPNFCLLFLKRLKENAALLVICAVNGILGDTFHTTTILKDESRDITDA